MFYWLHLTKTIHPYVSLEANGWIYYETINMVKPLWFERPQFPLSITTQKMKFSIKDFFSKCDQIRRFLRICSHLMKKSLMENFIFCVQSIIKKKGRGKNNSNADGYDTDLESEKNVYHLFQKRDKSEIRSKSKIRIHPVKSKR